MSFKDISYLKLWRPLCSTDRNHLCSFGRNRRTILRDYCEFEPVVQEEMLLKVFIIWGSGDPPVRWSRTIYAILLAVIMRNNSVKLFWIWASGSGGDIVKKISYLELCWPSCSVEQNHLYNCERGHHEKVYLCVSKLGSFCKQKKKWPKTHILVNVIDQVVRWRLLEASRSNGVGPDWLNKTRNVNHDGQ